MKAARVATQVSLTPLQDFAAKPIDLRSGWLEGVSEHILSQTDIIARPGPDSALLLSCQGRSWRYDGMRMITDEIKHVQLKSGPVSEEPMTNVRAPGTCRLQVSQGTYWSIQPNKESLALTRLTHNREGSLVHAPNPEQIRAPKTASPFLPLAVATNLIAFAESNAIAFYETASAPDEDLEAATSQQISVKRFQWDSRLHGMPLTAGRTADGYWILSKKSLVWFATRSDELRLSEWLQIQTFPVRFDETLRDAGSEKISTKWNLYLDDKTNLKSATAPRSSLGAVFLWNTPKQKESEENPSSL